MEAGRYAPVALLLPSAPPLPHSPLVLALRIAELFDTTVEDVFQINGKLRKS